MSPTEPSFPDAWSVSHVPPEQIDAVWPQIEPHVHRGLRYGAGDSTTPEEVYGDLIDAETMLWVVHEGDDIISATILQVLERPTGRVLYVVLIAGREFGKWAPHVNQLIMDYGQLINADAIEAAVRDGLTKWLPELGWKRKATIMELKNG